jgi:hypothetical protein
MRILLGIVILTVVVAVAWSIEPTTAKQRQTLAIDPVGMMSTATNLPEEQCDHF